MYIITLPDNVEAKRSRDKARLRAHTGSEEDAVLILILAQVFIYLQLFVPTGMV
jgi:hypothetical protein